MSHTFFLSYFFLFLLWALQYAFSVLYSHECLFWWLQEESVMGFLLAFLHWFALCGGVGFLHWFFLLAWAERMLCQASPHQTSTAELHEHEQPVCFQRCLSQIQNLEDYRRYFLYANVPQTLSWKQWSGRLFFTKSAFLLRAKQYFSLSLFMKQLAEIKIL